MRFLLDTNVCVRHLRSRSHDAFETRLLQSRQEGIAICSIVKAELVYGVRRSNRPIENFARLARFIDDLLSFPFDDAAAVACGELRYQLEASGTPIGPNDLMIASIALTRDLTLVTHNVREFERVSSLKVVDWETA